MFSTKFSLGSIALAAGLLASTAASALTLNTTDLKANATFAFSTQAFGSATAAGVTVAAAGNTTRGANTAEGNPSFILPVTKAIVTIGWDLKIRTQSGESSGAALRLETPSLGGVGALANFNIDYTKNIVYCDIIDAFLGTTDAKVALYNGKIVSPEVISLKGFVLNQRSVLGNLIFTPEAAQKVGDVLLIDEVLRASLATIDWGTIEAVVTSYKRPNKISNAPFTLTSMGY
ncbi:MAG TPA: hypothetical protein VFW84_00130 [Aquabacterium sp.]|uniref:hypothetical protein n=1 Tax=Aquabacterium sp. TaxID=1872578 RepID=UPI002E32EB78|nr:hypothetical protein [Aquabacterium sp.]HEX5371118.1 hypothetical protein [Aquabacterium sp.]